MNSIFRSVSVLGVLIVIAACGDPDRDLSRLEAPEEAAELTAEEERLRRLQLVIGEATLHVSSACCDQFDEAAVFEYVTEGTFKDANGSPAKITPLMPNADSVELLGEPEQLLSSQGRCVQCNLPVRLRGPVEDGWDAVVLAACGARSSLQSVPNPGEGASCEHLQPAERFLCAAAVLRELGQVRATSVGVEETTLTFPPQSSASNAAALSSAAEMAQQAAVEAHEGLLDKEWTTDLPQSGSGCVSAIDAGIDGYAFVTEATWASTFVEAYHLHGEITEELVDATLAVADAQRSWSSSVRQGVEWSVGGTALSRAAAAHSLVGGDEGLFLNNAPNGGFCTAPELTGQAQKAIDIFRQAAPNPLDVLAIPGAPWLDEYGLDPVNTDTLVNSVGDLEFGSLRERLAATYPELEIQDPLGVGTFTGLADLGLGIETFFRLEQTDFAEARAYLAEEIRAFSRSLTAVINPVTTTSCAAGCPSGECVTRERAICEGKGVFCVTNESCTDGAACITNVCATRDVDKRFAATAGPPMDMPDVYWTTMAQFSTRHTPDILRWAEGRAAFVGLAMTAAHDLVGDTNQPDSIKTVLDVLLTERPTVQLGQLVVDVQPSSETSIIAVGGLSASDGLRLVKGEDGLRCAITASIETAACDMEELTHTVLNGTLTSGTELAGRPIGYGERENAAKFFNAPEGDMNLYLVKPNNPGDATPGSFTALAGFRTVGEGPRRIFVLPIVPHAYARAAEVLKPSRKFCTSSSVSCAGFEFDERMPLEDELSDDQDDVESSWRHFLTLARQAADESDALGQSYVQSEIDVDVREETVSLREHDRRLRIEAELEVLQNICGTAMDTDRLLGLLSQGSPTDDFDLSDLRGDPCSSTTPCPDEAQMCIVDTCVWDPSALARQHPEDPDLLRLATCMNTEFDKKFVTMGNVPLCLFTREGNPFRPCDGRVGMNNCPGLPDDPEFYSTWPGNSTLNDSDDFADSGMCDEFIATTIPTGQEQHATVALPLGYFDVLEAPLPPNLATDTCDAIRGLRASLAASPQPSITKNDLLAIVRGSGIFGASARRDFARNVGWTPTLTGGSAVTLGGQTHYSVSPGPASDAWPCSGQPLGGVNCGSDREGLFCDSYDCTDSASVGALSQRLAEAVAAFVWTNDVASSGLLKKITVPQYAYLPPDVAPNWVSTFGDPIEFLHLSWPQAASLFGTTYFRYTGPAPAPPAWIAPDGTALPFQDADGRYFALSNNGSFSRGSIFGEGWRCGGTPCDFDCWAGKAAKPDLDALREQYQVDPLEAECDDPISCTLLRAEQDLDDVTFGHGREALAIASGGLSEIGKAIFGAPGDPGSFYCLDPRPEDTAQWWFGLAPSDPLLTASEWRVESTPIHRGYFYHMWAGHAPTSNFYPFEEAFRALDGGVLDVSVGFIELGIPWPFEHQGSDSWINSERLPPDLITNGLLEFGTFTDPALDPSSPQYNSADPILRSHSLLDANGFDAQSLFDAAELYCQIVENPSGSEPVCDLSSPPALSTVNDLVKMKTYLHCLADDLENNAGRQIFPNFPYQVYAMLRGSGIGGFGATGGEFGESVSLLRGALNDIGSFLPAMSDTIRSIGLQMDDLRLALLDERISNDIAVLDIMSSQMEAVAQCNAALSPTYSFGVSSGSGTGSGVGVSFPPSASYSSGVSAGQSEGASLNAGAANAVCANSLAQADFGAQLQGLVAEGLNNEIQSDALVLWDNYQQSISDLLEMARDLGTAFELINAQLADIEGVRNQAKRALSRALFMGSFQADNQEQISTALRARRDIERRRYEVARENAVKLAFLAKRAIEQRLGVRLSEMREDLPLVEAPSTWEAEVCTSSGLDYEALSDPDQAGQAAENFADAFVGDYVTKLENLIQSYRLINNFQDGTDTAVISLRDDVHNVKAECEVPSDNLLYYSNDLSHVVPAAFDARGWSLLNCEVDDGTGELVPIPGCLVTAPVTDGSDEQLPSSELGKPVLWQIDGNSDAELVQSATFLPGVYRLSWFGSVANGTVQAVDADDGIIQVLDSDQNQRFPTIHETESALAQGVWRNSVTFDVTVATDARVSIKPPPAGLSDLRLGGVMLELVSLSTTEDGSPNAFVETLDTRSVVLPACEDTGGAVFRADRWRYGCDRLCQDGFTGTCSGSDAETHCYWETLFNINQRSIEVGDQLTLSGFARGNFNYRIDSVGVNFVGTGTRNCANSPNPSTCYGGGFIPYSLRHDGPFLVRNHLGQEFRASLFPGRIEHARGLASERYLTNPISKSDQELLDPYMRSEFQGRPASGNFAFRIWVEPGIDFESIADVQLVLKYRYWTRSE